MMLPGAKWTISLSLIMSHTVYLNRISQEIASDSGGIATSKEPLLLPCMVFHAQTCILMKSWHFFFFFAPTE